MKVKIYNVKVQRDETLKLQDPDWRLDPRPS